MGDAFLKFAVGRHVFLVNNSLDEGILTRKRSNMVNNSHLFRLALSNNLQVSSYLLCYSLMARPFSAKKYGLNMPGQHCLYSNMLHLIRPRAS